MLLVFFVQLDTSAVIAFIAYPFFVSLSAVLSNTPLAVHFIQNIHLQVKALLEQSVKVKAVVYFHSNLQILQPQIKLS